MPGRNLGRIKIMRYIPLFLCCLIFCFSISCTPSNKKSDQLVVYYNSLNESADKAVRAELDSGNLSVTIIGNAGFEYLYMSIDTDENTKRSFIDTVLKIPGVKEYKKSE